LYDLRLWILHLVACCSQFRIEHGNVDIFVLSSNFIYNFDDMKLIIFYISLNLIFLLNKFFLLSKVFSVKAQSA